MRFTPKILVLRELGGCSVMSCRFVCASEWWFVVLRGGLVVRCGQVKCEGLPQLSPVAALCFDLFFNCSELGVTHTPSLEEIF